VISGAQTVAAYERFIRRRDHQRPRDRRRSLHQGQGVLCFVCALGDEYRDQHGCSQGESGREWRAGQGRGSQVNPGLITI